jgi:hypothetical protein
VVGSFGREKMEPTETVASSIPELFYDLLSILMPGVYLLIAIYFIKNGGVEDLIRSGIIYPALTGIVLAYLLGFLLYSISSLIVAKPFSWLLGQPAYFLLLGDLKRKHLRRHQWLFLGIPTTPEHLHRGVERSLRQLQGDSNFKITDNNINEVYEFCRNYVMERSARRAISIRKEQAYGEMCRAIVVISLALLLTLPLLRWLAGIPKEWFWLQLVVHAIFLLAFSFRYAQARLIAPYLIYATFSIMILMKSMGNQGPESTA